MDCTQDAGVTHRGRMLSVWMIACSVCVCSWVSASKAFLFESSSHFPYVWWGMCVGSLPAVYRPVCVEELCEFAFGNVWKFSILRCRWSVHPVCRWVIGSCTSIWELILTWPPCCAVGTSVPEFCRLHSCIISPQKVGP